MTTQLSGDMHTTQPAGLRLVLAFLALFVAYQLPEGLGMRVLGSMPVAAGLMVAFLPVAWLTGRWLGFPRMDAWYLAPRRGWLRMLLGTFVLAVLAKVLALTAGSAAGVYAVGFPAGLTVSSVLLAALAMLPWTFIPSIAEDIVTRGFLMRALPALSRRHLFIACSALLYVLNHIYRLHKGPVEMAMLFCFGLAYAGALFYSRSLWPAVGLHWGWNFAGQFGDRVASIDLLEPALGPALSSTAHLAMLGVIVLAFGRRRRGGTAGLPV